MLSRKLALCSISWIEADFDIAKPGVLTLEELDKFRYVDAPAQFSKTAGGQTLALVDVQKLVEWKLYVPHFSEPM
jgi:hypothetical protein